LWFFNQKQRKRKKIANCQCNGSECKLFFPNIYKVSAHWGLHSLGRYRETKFQHLQTLKTDQNEVVHPVESIPTQCNGGVFG